MRHGLSERKDMSGKRLDYKWRRLGGYTGPRLSNGANSSKPVLIVKPVPNGTDRYNFYSGRNESHNFVNYISSHQELGDGKFAERALTANFGHEFKYVDYMRLDSKRYEPQETIDDRKNV